MSSTATPVATPAKPIVRPPLRPSLRMTEAEFVAWADEDTNAEWVAGEVQFKYDPGASLSGEVQLKMASHEDHDEYQALIRGAAEAIAKRRGLGRVRGPDFTVRFAGTLGGRREPDVLFVATENLARLTPTLCVGPPDLIVEIVSPESVHRDYREKFLQYQAAGVREYWIVDPSFGRIEANWLVPETGEYKPMAEQEGLLRSTVLPGFDLRPATFFDKPIPDLLTFAAALGLTA